MYQSKLIEDIEVNYNGLDFFVDLDVTAKLVDGSFSHGFGLESCQEIEIDSSEVETVYNHEGDIVTSREIVTAIKNLIDPSEYIDKFSSDDFEN